jgi:hypothetical protein
VVDNGILIGLITQSSLIRALAGLDEIPEQKHLD